MKDKFNENLREARRRKKLTQQQVADKLGIAKSTYCQYETGASEPNVLRLKELAKILETTGDALDNAHLEYSQKAVSAFQQTFQVE